ncbi:MAG: hypothetical protein ABL962_03890 [Fimbriimonadaceae bacterium]
MKWGRKHRWWFGLGIALAVLALGTLKFRVPKREPFGFIALNSRVYSAESLLTDEYEDFYVWSGDYAMVVARARKELAAKGALALPNDNFDLPDGTRLRLRNCDTQIHGGSVVFVGRRRDRVSAVVTKGSPTGLLGHIRRLLHLP